MTETRLYKILRRASPTVAWAVPDPADVAAYDALVKSIPGFIDESRTETRDERTRVFRVEGEDNARALHAALTDQTDPRVRALDDARPEGVELSWRLTMIRER